MYHHVADGADFRSHAPYCVTPNMFTKQLDLLQSLRAQCVTVSQAVGEPRNRGKTIAITFDDCPVNLLDHAIPELEKRGLLATFYAVADKLNGTNDWDHNRGKTRVRLMNSGELQSLASAGHEIGSHGMTHVRLDEVDAFTLHAELHDSRSRLESEIGCAVTSLAFPFGGIPKDHAVACRNTGYGSACAIFSPASSVLADPYALRRILIHERDIGLRLRFKLSQVYLFMRRYVDRRALAHDQRPTPA